MNGHGLHPRLYFLIVYNSYYSRRLMGEVMTEVAEDSFLSYLEHMTSHITPIILLFVGYVVAEILSFGKRLPCHPLFAVRNCPLW